MAELWFKELAGYVALAAEVATAMVVLIGGAEAVVGVVRTFLTTGMTRVRRREIWVRFAIWILLSLEFALAADIVRTAIAPTWDDVGKLGAIAAIRTILNWFLTKDIEAYSEENRPAEAASAP